MHNNNGYYPGKSYTVLPSSHAPSHPPRRRTTLLGSSRTQKMVLFILAFGLLLLVINIYELRLMQVDHLAMHGGAGVGSGPYVEGSVGRMEGQPIVWVTGKRVDSGYLKHVFAVFERLGYIRGDQHSEWDVMWAHDYPFSTYKDIMTKLKPHQKVNHFPGSGFLTNKLSLVTSGIDTRYIPKAFKMPKDKDKFLEYVGENPKTKWVQKGNNHRGVVIRSKEDLDLTVENTFIQEYIDDPYLIDNRRFDIGIYTTLTSVNPLRVYIFEGEWLIRFCPDEYYPFDPNNKNKYVISDDYMPPWKIPSLKKYYSELDFNRKQSLFAHLRNDGRDPEKLAQTLKDAISQVYLKMEQKFITAVSNFRHQRNFFEMVRFDFVLDDKLNVYLLEVNLSPNLSSGHFPPNKLLYEQVVYSMLSLVGVAKATSSDIIKGTEDEMNMQVCSKDVHTFIDICASHKCHESCSKLTECRLCRDCLKRSQVDSLQHAYLEHLHRHTWRRVLPRTFKSQHEAANFEGASDPGYESLSPANQWMTQWFRGKCLQDAAWCA